MTEQATDDAERALTQAKRGQQVQHDVIVVARVQREMFGTSGIGYRSDHFQCRVAIERSDLYSDHVVNLAAGHPFLHAKAVEQAQQYTLISIPSVQLPAVPLFGGRQPAKACRQETQGIAAGAVGGF